MDAKSVNFSPSLELMIDLLTFIRPWIDTHQKQKRLDFILAMKLDIKKIMITQFYALFINRIFLFFIKGLILGWHLSGISSGVQGGSSSCLAPRDILESHLNIFQLCTFCPFSTFSLLFYIWFLENFRK